MTRKHTNGVDIRVGQLFITDKRPVSERKMILSILWEGDLEIHTNKELMSGSSFGARIVHGDAVTALATGLLLKMEPFSKRNWKMESISCSYQRAVFIGEEIFGSFEVTEMSPDCSNICLKYEVTKNDKEVVSTGTLSISCEHVEDSEMGE